MSQYPFVTFEIPKTGKTIFYLDISKPYKIFTDQPKEYPKFNTYIEGIFIKLTGPHEIQRFYGTNYSVEELTKLIENIKFNNDSRS